MKFKKAITICMTLLVICTVLLAICYSVLFSRTYPTDYLDIIEKYSSEYGVPCELVLAVVNVESKFDINAVSSKNAKGLMQLMPSTAEEMAYRLKISEYDIMSPEDNIMLGSYYLAYLYRYFDDWHNSVAAYNAGITNVKAWLGNTEYSPDGKTLENIPFSETENFVKKVFADMEKYKTILEEKNSAES